MPGFLLHLGAQVLCAHGGTATPPVTNPRVLVSGTPTAPMPSPYLVAGCALPPPPAANGPCVTAPWTTGTVRVLSSGQPLAVMGGTATCAPTGTPLLLVSAQTRVIAS
jgi:hypothetical protein